MKFLDKMKYNILITYNNNNKKKLYFKKTNIKNN